MSLTFVGPRGSFERRWILYAMLRDNVQYHLEGGTPGEFIAIHALGEALVHGKVTVSAVALRAELERARTLVSKPLSELAVSIRTRAVCTLKFPLPDVRGATLVSVSGWSVPFELQGASTLGDVFGSLVDELLNVTEGAEKEDEVTVVDS